MLFIISAILILIEYLELIIFTKMPKINNIVIIIDVVICIILYITIRKWIEEKFKFSSNFKEKYYKEIPNIKPAVITYLLYGNTKTINAIEATILDLINRKYLNITKKKDDYILTINKDIEELCTYEKNLIEWIFGKLNNGNEINFSNIKEKLKKDNFSELRFEAWKNLIKVESRKSNVFINEKKEKLN